MHNPDAAAAIFDITTRFALRALRALLVLGVLVMLGAWVVGPSTTATKIRTWWDSLLGRATESGAEHELGPVPRFVTTYERALTVGVAALGLLTLVLWTHPTGMVILLIVVVTFLALAAVRLLAAVDRQTGPIPADDKPAIDLRDPDPHHAPTEPVEEPSDTPDRA